MDWKPRLNLSHLSGKLIASVLLFALAATAAVDPVQGGDNLERLSIVPLEIRDIAWDRRLYDGTIGDAVSWRHNPTNKPVDVNLFEFLTAVQKGFAVWSALDDFLNMPPLIPEFLFGGFTTVTRAGAIDGINAIVWQNLGTTGILAITPCTSLTEPSTTTTGPFGGTRLPIGDGRSIPFPGPPGVTYPAGTIIDCGIAFNTNAPWVNSGGSAGFDMQSVATHEIGHLLGLSHSTVGLSTADSSDDATMIPFADNTDNLRSPKYEDLASVFRTYLRTNGLERTLGGFATIVGRIQAGPDCQNATGVSVRAYEATTGFEGSLVVETFSGSNLRQGLPHEPFDGSFELNVLPGVAYTLATTTLVPDLTAPFSSFRFNPTTIFSNTKTEESIVTDQLLEVGPLSPGEVLDVGDLGILGCTP
ncbi:MAG TPA: matrixin family metalloprotease [Acidobacteriota bacterium]|nr:matrixin family metalloprotease [Acidobacteriota bacterium]